MVTLAMVGVTDVGFRHPSSTVSCVGVVSCVRSAVGENLKQVIQASGGMPYEPHGFTNCVRFKDVLYLSAISGCCRPADQVSTGSCR
jgi:hypothetical protein